MHVRSTWQRPRQQQRRRRRPDSRPHCNLSIEQIHRQLPCAVNTGRERGRRSSRRKRKHDETRTGALNTIGAWSRVVNVWPTTNNLFLSILPQLLTKQHITQNCRSLSFPLQRIVYPYLDPGNGVDDKSYHLVRRLVTC